MSTRELEDALAGLERLARSGDSPSHYVARHVLLTLGKALRTNEPAGAVALARAREAGQACGESWLAAIRDELTLACGEFAQCLDPRFLELPNYDGEYTRAARSRLEDRLRAAGELGVALTSRETDLLELADRVLAAWEERRGPGERAERLPVEGPDGPERPSHKR